MSALLDTEQIAALLRRTRKHVTDRVTKEPTFPAPVIDLSRRTRLWSEVAVMEWLQQPKGKQRAT